MQEDSFVKTIAELKINVGPAIEGIDKLTTSVNNLNQALGVTTGDLKKVGPAINDAISEPMKRAGQDTEDVGNQVKKVTEGMLSRLDGIAKRLSNVQKVAATVSKQTGTAMHVPGVEQQRQTIMALREQLQVGQEIDSQMIRQIDHADEFSKQVSHQVGTLKNVKEHSRAITEQTKHQQMSQKSATRETQATSLAQAEINSQKQKEAALNQQTVASMQAKAATTIKQLRQHQLMDTSLANQLISLREQISSYEQIVSSGQALSQVEQERLASMQQQLGVLQQQAKTMIADTTSTGTHMGGMEGEAGQSILGSQYDRRVSWFLAGTGFYGGIRAMRSAMSTIAEVESDMTVIARTTQDATFQLHNMRDALIDIGQEYGHTWDIVSEVAIEWTRAGYNVADSLELVRTSLLALNVAEMDVKQATTGLIAIMSQWEFEASELEGVIDKLNITSDRFPITTGDLIDALLRSSGAARAANIEFEELVGMVTATRTASGRAGREIGNAMNTILSFITRQSTLNHLMAEGIQVFTDATEENFVPALDLFDQVVDKWQDNVEEIPQQFIDIADSMGVFNEEMAETMGMEKEWTDLEKVRTEQAMGGVRRRQFLIALLRNFSEVQEVVNNLQEAEGYSMLQNIRTMGTLEKQYAQLRTELTRLSVAIGDSGLMGQMKTTVSVTTDLVSWFGQLDESTQTLLVTLGQFVLILGIVKSLIKMLGGAVLGAKIGTALGPVGTVVGAVAGVGIGTYYMHQRRMTEEHKMYIETVNAVIEVQERLDSTLERSIEGSIAHNTALEEKREIINALVDQYPELIDGYDTETGMYILNKEALEEAKQAQEEMNEANKNSMETTRGQIDVARQQAQQYEQDAERVERLFQERERMIESMEKEGLTAEEQARRKEKLAEVDDLLIRMSQQTDSAMQTSAEITRDAVNSIVEDYMRQASAREESVRRILRAEWHLTRGKIAVEKHALREATGELQDISRSIGEIQPRSWMDQATDAFMMFPRYLWTGEQPSDYIEETVQGRTVRRAMFPDLQKHTLDKQLDEARKTVGEHERNLRGLESDLRELDEIMAESLTGGDSGGEPYEPYDPDEGADTGAGTGAAGSAARTAEEVEKLTSIIREYIANAMRAAEVQGMANDEIQRYLDLTRAKIDYFVHERMTEEEKVRVLNKELELREALAEKQRGIQTQIGLLESAMEKLIRKQSEINTSTEDGQDAYLNLESQIESVRGEINKLTMETYKLSREQEKAAASTQILQNELQRIDFITRLGVRSTEQLVQKYRQAYSAIQDVRALTFQEEMQMISNLSGGYKDMFDEIKQQAEDAYRERVKSIEEAADAEVKVLERMIERLDEQDRAASREDAQHDHIQRMKGLHEDRLYHEQRTGIEHQKAIADIDKNIAEEHRDWQRQQDQWAREDAKERLRAQIDEVRAQADAVKAQWEEAYQRMQADFSQHNINMITTASAFDEAFYADAWNKAQMWLKGFMEGLPADIVGGYLAGLVGQAEGIIGRKSSVLRTAQTRSISEFEHEGGRIKGVLGEDVFEGDVIETAGGDYRIVLDPDDPRGYKGVKIPQSHIGSKVLEEGLAHLVPGNLIFPPNISAQMERLIQMMSTRQVPSPKQVEGGKMVSINELLHVDTMQMDDRVDATLLSRELRRQMSNIA